MEIWGNIDCFVHHVDLLLVSEEEVNINQSKWQVMKERKCETTIRKLDEEKKERKKSGKKIRRKWRRHFFVPDSICRMNALNTLRTRTSGGRKRIPSLTHSHTLTKHLIKINGIISFIEQFRRRFTFDIQLNGFDGKFCNSPMINEEKIFEGIFSFTSSSMSCENAINK